MTIKKLLVFWAGLGLLSIAVASCDEFRGPGGGNANQWADVNVTVHKPVPAALMNGLGVTGAGQIGTSLIVVVPEGATPTPYFEQLAVSDVLDQALLDLGTSSVSLSIPLGVSVQLFEYTFNDSLTLAELQANPPVAGTPNVSNAFTMEAGLSEISLLLTLQTTTVNETFDAGLSDVFWERVDADATVSGGVLSMSTSAAYDSTLSPAERYFGASTILQTNRNLQLANQRIAGTIRVSSFSTFDDVGAAAPAQANVIAGLYYQPRSGRGTVRTGLTGVRIMFVGITGGTPVFVMNAFTCLNDTCASAADRDFAATLPFAFVYGGAPTSDIPFELEYKGGGIFEGTFSGETITVNLPALGATVFNENDFLYARLQTQGAFMQDTGDTAAITVVFDDLVAGNGAVDGIAVTPTGGLLVNEVGTTDTFSVVLTSAPNADVKIDLTNSDTTEATISTPSLTFTSVNWSVPQTVTVTGVDDFVADGNQPVTITTAAAVSTDVDYNGLDAPDVFVTVVDDDAPGITPSVGTIVTSETPTSANFTIVLNSQPTANVTIGLSSSDTTEGTVSPASLTFSAANWSTPQAVTVTGVDDVLNDGSITYTIITAAAVSTDTGYSGLNAADVTGTNLDNDSIVVDAATGNNANPGTDALPVKTITQGLTLTGGLITGVLVRPGLYDTANGETFPITVPTGVSLIGDEANKGRGATFTTISGGGVPGGGFTRTTVLHANGSTQIRGFNLINPGANPTLALAVNGVALFNNSFINAAIHVIWADGGGHGIVGNVVDNAGGVALVARSTVMSRVAGNTFTRNTRAVETQAIGTVDLGGGGTGSAGGNIFSCNTTSDIRVTGADTISATNNFWDHAPPTGSATDGGGIDFFDNSIATLTSTGAAVAAAPCP